jgi:hypothetical protein
MSRLALFVTLSGASFLGAPVMQAQPPSAAQFDVVSIRPNMAVPGSGGGMRTLPDGTFMMTNQPIRSIILAASPVPARDVVGLPDWVNNRPR